MLDPFDSLAVPSPEDLLGLRKLMGSNAKTVEYLAKLYNMETEAIRPTVEEWLAALPRIPPPSRQRSAPAEFFSPVALEMRLKAAAAASKRGPAQILEVNLPPPSAPVQGRGRAASGDRLQTQAAMRALNTKLNSRAIAAYSGRAPLADASLNQQQSNLGFKRKVLVGPTAPGSSTFLTAVPEDVEDQKAAITMNPLAAHFNGLNVRGPAGSKQDATEDAEAEMARAFIARKYNQSSGADEAGMRAYLERSALMGGRIGPTVASVKPVGPWWN